MAGLADAKLELLHDIGDLFESVHVIVLPLGGMGDHKESCPLEEHHLVRPADPSRACMASRNAYIDRRGREGGGRDGEGIKQDASANGSCSRHMNNGCGFTCSHSPSATQTF